MVSGIEGNDDPPHNAEDQALFMAISFANLAIEADRNANYEEALRLYLRSVTYLRKIPSGTTKNWEQLLGERCLQYLRRAEILKCYLENNSQNYEAAGESSITSFNTTVVKILFMERFCSNCSGRVASSSSAIRNCGSCSALNEKGFLAIAAKEVGPSAPPEENPDDNLAFCDTRETATLEDFPKMMEMKFRQCDKIRLLLINIISHLFD